MKKNTRKKNKTVDILDGDLSHIIGSSDFKKKSFHFEIQSKDKSVTLRMPSKMLLAFKEMAKNEGVSYQKLMRQALEFFIKKSA